jgi:hypothetical protein
MSPADACPICQHTALKIGGNEPWLEGAHAPYYQCPVCKDFMMPDIVASWWQNNARHRGYQLSDFVRQRHIHQAGAPLLLSSFEGLPEHPNYVFRIEDALASFPRTVPERLDCALLNLAALSPKPGSWVRLANGSDYPIGYAEDDEAFDYLLGQLGESGYLALSPSRTHGDDVPPAVQLTAAGWNSVAELERPAVGENSRQAFVAMWFDDAVKSAYTDGIKPAIEQAGYAPVRIDAVEHNDRIDDRIIAEIRKSHFLVADFTGHRQGVYLEAGYTLALPIPVIWTVRQDELKGCHFDTRQFNHIDWQTPEELRSRLLSRIQATIPSPADT